MPIIRTDNLNKAEVIIGQTANKYFQVLGRDLAAIVRYKARFDTGQFRQGVVHAVRGFGFETYLTVGAYSENAPFVEFGRRPGKRPPPKVIQAWCARKGLPAKAAFPIGRAIGKRGIKGQLLITNLKTDQRALIDSTYNRMNLEISRTLSG